MGVKALSVLETARAPVSVASITKVAKEPPSIGLFRTSKRRPGRKLNSMTLGTSSSVFHRIL